MLDLRGLSLQERMEELNEGIYEYSNSTKQKEDFLMVQTDTQRNPKSVEISIKISRKRYADFYLTFIYPLPNQENACFDTEEEYDCFNDYRYDLVFRYLPLLLKLLKEAEKSRKIKGQEVLDDMAVLGDYYQNCSYNLDVINGKLLFDCYFDNEVSFGSGFIDFGVAYKEKISDILNFINKLREETVKYLKLPFPKEEH